MDSRQPTHQYAASASIQTHGLHRSVCDLVVRQQPKHACLNVAREKDRKTIDPPPIVQLRVSKRFDPDQQFLQSPYYFMFCNLVGHMSTGQAAGTLGSALTGNVVSSLHRLKDPDNDEGAFFIFADLSVKMEGTFRLEFNLFEMREADCIHITTVRSEPFKVLPKKSFPGMMESTTLTRTFSDQGVRLRLRKEPRALLKKRGPASDDYLPRHYKTSDRKTAGTKERPPSSQVGSYRTRDENVRPRQHSVASYGSSQPPYIAQGYANIPQLEYTRPGNVPLGQLAPESIHHGSMRQNLFGSPPYTNGAYTDQAPFYAHQQVMQNMAYPLYSNTQLNSNARYNTALSQSAFQREPPVHNDSNFVSESFQSPSLYLRSSPQSQQLGQYQAFGLGHQAYIPASAASDTVAMSPLEKFSSGSESMSASPIPGEIFNVRQPTYRASPWNIEQGYESTGARRDDKSVS